MKTYIVYCNGIEIALIKAGSHNAAEKKAKKKYGNGVVDITVAYTEV
jgi:hypothetical protein